MSIAGPLHTDPAAFSYEARNLSKTNYRAMRSQDWPGLPTRWAALALNAIGLISESLCGRARVVERAADPLHCAWMFRPLLRHDKVRRHIQCHQHTHEHKQEKPKGYLYVPWVVAATFVW